VLRCAVHLCFQGKYDDLPEMAFYMVGDITEVQEKADKMAKDIAARKVRAAGLGPRTSPLPSFLAYVCCVQDWPAAMLCSLTKILATW
jgi:hypothetical protein